MEDRIKKVWEEIKDKPIEYTLQKIAELEDKLAESENKVRGFVELFDKKQHENYEQFCEIQQLKQQLAEKEKEIKNVTLKHLDMLRYFIRHNSKQGIILSSDLEREIEEIEQGEKNWQNKNFNQDKISFCIEQLEKLKEKVICGVMDIGNDFWDCFVRDGSSYMTSENLYDALEQEFTFQIQELKKELNK